MTEYSIDNWKDVFEPDGALLDIVAFDTTYTDCSTLVEFVSSRYECSYYENTLVLPFPGLEAAYKRVKKHNTFLSIDVAGCTSNWHFWGPDWIEIDFYPNYVDTREKAEAMFDFLSSIAKLLNKPSFLTPEQMNTDDEQRREHAICRADPPDGHLTFGHDWH